MSELSQAHIRSGRVMTVNGPVPAQDMGVTLMHEHILNDCRCWWNPPQEPERAHLGSGFARILRERRQQQGSPSCQPRRGRESGEGHGIVTDNLVVNPSKQIGSRLGCVGHAPLDSTAEMFANAWGDGGPETMPPQAGDSVAVRRRVWSGRAGPDGAEIIADHIRQNERHDRGTA